METGTVGCRAHCLLCHFCLVFFPEPVEQFRHAVNECDARPCRDHAVHRRITAAYIQRQIYDIQAEISGRYIDRPVIGPIKEVKLASVYHKLI